RVQGAPRPKPFYRREQRTSRARLGSKPQTFEPRPEDWSPALALRAPVKWFGRFGSCAVEDVVGGGGVGVSNRDRRHQNFQTSIPLRGTQRSRRGHGGHRVQSVKLQTCLISSVSPWLGSVTSVTPVGV